jgi:hypothetical protein
MDNTPPQSAPPAPPAQPAQIPPLAALAAVASARHLGRHMSADALSQIFDSMVELKIRCGFAGGPDYIQNFVIFELITPHGTAQVGVTDFRPPRLAHVEEFKRVLLESMGAGGNPSRAHAGVSDLILASLEITSPVHISVVISMSSTQFLVESRTGFANSQIQTEATIQCCPLTRAYPRLLRFLDILSAAARDDGS